MSEPITIGEAICEWIASTANPAEALPCDEQATHRPFPLCDFHAERHALDTYGDAHNCDTCGQWFDLEEGGHHSHFAAIAMCPACCRRVGWFDHGTCWSC